MFAAAALALLATIALALARAALGPTLFDRAQARTAFFQSSGSSLMTLIRARTSSLRLVSCVVDASSAAGQLDARS